jgi:hypothetical protein
MIITQDLVDTTRKLLNESIPQSGTEADTRFTDAMIEAVLLTSDTINQALYFLWTQKVGLVQSGGEIKQISADGDTITKYTKMDYVKMCMETAQGYKNAWDKEKTATGSFAAISIRRRCPSVW